MLISPSAAPQVPGAEYVLRLSEAVLRLRSAEPSARGRLDTADEDATHSVSDAAGDAETRDGGRRAGESLGWGRLAGAGWQGGGCGWQLGRTWTKVDRKSYYTPYRS